MQIEKIQITYTDGQVEYVDTDRQALDKAKDSLKAIIKEEGLKQTQIVVSEDGEEVILLVMNAGVREDYADCIITPMLIKEDKVEDEINKANFRNESIVRARKEAEEREKLQAEARKKRQAFKEKQEKEKEKFEETLDIIFHSDSFNGV